MAKRRGLRIDLGEFRPGRIKRGIKPSQPTRLPAYKKAPPPPPSEGSKEKKDHKE